MSESQCAARLAALGIDLENEGLGDEALGGELRAVLLDGLRSGRLERGCDLALLVEYLALRELGPLAEQVAIPGWNHLYVLSFAGARPVVKVGRTGRFAGRLRDLRAPEERGGNVLFKAWASEPVYDAHPWEQAVLRMLRSRHDPSKVEGERFYDLDHAEAMNVVHQQRIWVSPCSVGLPLSGQLSAEQQSLPGPERRPAPVPCQA
ncbi:GIY-YIG nuclease family protein [Kitasatospora purpeofusca]|uniref:GIY-YIG nuclease family protein n=1 Tax=Kitasatospora purpeofusca TaxID=67352 RepID=UPI00369EE594